MIAVVVMMMMETLIFCVPTVCLTLLNPYDYPEKQEVEVGDVIGFWIYLGLLF